ncbi:hypothetical protein L1266_17730 [Pseudoalteromonas sp. Cn5-37]|uniref:hypothetical protein n=1 Tax=Pseudoalteromonas sp. Cn5-37 TaxID=2908886 RepID=UPI001F458591|nr:hypothetical protein [Pseudoalteromonas sp. Cn5-37]MCF2918019.1 hypothetical protein [Pseudoalteromonas sp. Cn5-37]
MKIELYLPVYKQFEYEKKFALLELKQITECFFIDMIESTELGYEFDFTDEARLPALVTSLKRLTYVAHIKINSEIIDTYQGLLEKSCPVNGHQKRQPTRYGAHGIHEYKGKFNPQIVSSILQQFSLKKNSKVLEPFCGSGTTLYESSIKGFENVGFDVNPLAVFLANTKLASINLSLPLAKKELMCVISNSKMFVDTIYLESNERLDYLKNWFDIEQLKKIESFRLCANKIKKKEIRDSLLCIASNIIKEYSQQEPADLRIRRRKSLLPEKCFFEVVQEKAEKYFSSLETISQVLPANLPVGNAKNIDIRDTFALQDYFDYFDFAITSPPYATALPYIDTQRLSLVWLELASPKNIKVLDSTLIGSRELKKSEQNKLKEDLVENKDKLPEKLHNLCLDMLGSLTDNDGFRRQAMPFLVYRYFVDMKKMFENVLSMLKDGGKFALVVGHNKTTLGGVVFELNTPSYLATLAEHIGWDVSEIVCLDAYPRYDLHQSNSIDSESLVLLQK